MGEVQPTLTNRRGVGRQSYLCRKSDGHNNMAQASVDGVIAFMALFRIRPPIISNGVGASCSVVRLRTIVAGALNQSFFKTMSLPGASNFEMSWVPQCLPLSSALLCFVIDYENECFFELSSVIQHWSSLQTDCSNALGLFSGYQSSSRSILLVYRLKFQALLPLVELFRAGRRPGPVLEI